MMTRPILHDSRNVRIEQSLDLDAKSVRAAGPRVNRGPVAPAGRWKFPGSKLKGDDTQRVIVLSKTGTADGALGRGIIARAPRKDFRAIDLAGAFEIDQVKLIAPDKNMGRFAIAPNPAGDMDSGENRFQPSQNFFRAPP